MNHTKELIRQASRALESEIETVREKPSTDTLFNGQRVDGLASGATDYQFTSYQQPGGQGLLRHRRVSPDAGAGVQPAPQPRSTGERGVHPGGRCRPGRAARTRATLRTPADRRRALSGLAPPGVRGARLPRPG